MPVRLGLPNYAGPLAEVMRNPRFSTGIGLLMAASEQHKRREMTKLGTGSFQQVFQRMKEWFQANF